VRKRPGLVMGHGRNPLNSRGGRTTRIDNTMVRIKKGNRFVSKRTGQRREAKEEESYVMVLRQAEARWPCEAYFDTRMSPTWISPEVEA
jgi:hypothetical protein